MSKLRKTIFVVFASLASLATGSAQAQSDSTTREPASAVLDPTDSAASRSAIRSTDVQSPVHIPEGEEAVGLSGDWGGQRRKLSEKGLDFAVIGKYDLGRNFSGGVRVGSFGLWNLDVRASLDTEKIGAWKGGSFFLYFLVDQGAKPSTYVGDAQFTSNIETLQNVSRLYEAWYQHLFLDDKVSVLIGLHDLNSEFYVTDTSTLFLNASFGIGYDLSQTAPNGPSIFPVTAPCVRLRVEPNKNFYLQTAAFSAVAGDPDQPGGTKVKWGPGDGSLLITEAAALVPMKDSDHNYFSKYALGTWVYTKTATKHVSTVQDSLGNPVPENGTNSGTYILVDQGITRDISAFLRTGFAASEVNPAQSNIAAGVGVKGTLWNRPNDLLGLAMTMITSSSDFRDQQEAEGNPIDNHEITTEFTYRAELTPGLVLQPDLQYIDRPSFSKEISYALSGIVRIELSF